MASDLMVELNCAPFDELSDGSVCGHPSLLPRNLWADLTTFLVAVLDQTGICGVF